MATPAVVIVGRLGGPDAFSSLVVVAGCMAVLREKLFVGILLLMISIWIRTDNIVIVLVLFGWLVWDRKLSGLYAGVLTALAIGSVEWINTLSGNYGWRVLLHYSFIGGKYPAEIRPGISLVEYAYAFAVNAESLVPQLAPWLLLGIAAWSLRSRERKFLVPVVDLPAGVRLPLRRGAIRRRAAALRGGQRKTAALPRDHHVGLPRDGHSVHPCSGESRKPRPRFVQSLRRGSQSRNGHNSAIC